MNQSAFQQVIKEAQLRLGWSIFGFLLSLGVGSYYSEEFVFFFAFPTKMAGIITEFLCTQMTEAFRTYLKVSFVVSLYASAPLFFYQIWCFFIPSCTKQKRQSATRWLIVSTILFYGAFLCAYCFVVPITWSFFISQCSSSISLLHFEFQPKIYDYINLLFRFMLIFGLCSQVPLAVAWFIRHRAQKKALRTQWGTLVPRAQWGTLVPRTQWGTLVPRFHSLNFKTVISFDSLRRVISSGGLRWDYHGTSVSHFIRPTFHSSPTVFHSSLLLFYRKKIFFFSICIAAVLSPPDVWSQLIVLLPTYLLIEIVIFYEILLGEYNLVG